MWDALPWHGQLTVYNIRVVLVQSVAKSFHIGCAVHSP
jgi:hypothetical protein